MSRQIAILLPFALFLLLAGCATKGPKDSELVFHQHAGLAEPRPDKGLVYFFREQTMACSYNYYVYDGFDQLGGLACKSWFHSFVEPGRHLFWGEADYRGEAVFDIAPGSITYIKVETIYNEFGLPRSPSFEKVSESEGRKALLSLPRVELR